MLNAQARISAAVLASGTLHLLLAFDPPKEQALRRRVDLSDQMDFEVVYLSAEPHEDVRQVPEAEPEPALARPSRSPREERAPLPAAALPEALPVPPALPLSTASPAAAQRSSSVDEQEAAPNALRPSPAAESAARTLDLSARSAARTISAESGTSWSIPRVESGPAREQNEVGLAAEERLAQAIPELSRAGNDKVDHIAEEVTMAIAKPWELILRPLRGARYHFRGTGFDAIIRGDGGVQYRDKSGIRITASQTLAPTSGFVAGNVPPPAQTFGLGSDGTLLSKWFGRNDPHQSERRRFLERTRALRELLHERGTRAALARAARHLDRNLAVIAGRLETGDDGPARAQLFALWDDCAEDEIGNIARTRIETFVREHCREGSATTFDASELSALNRKRLSRQRFAPYALLADAGTEAADASREGVPNGDPP